MESDSDSELPDLVERETTETSSSKSDSASSSAFMSLFKQPTKGQAPPKVRKIQKDEHFCLVCSKVMSRGNPASRKRHAETNHADDDTYDFRSAIVSYDHELAVKARKMAKQKKSSRIQPSDVVRQDMPTSSNTPLTDQSIPTESVRISDQSDVTELCNMSKQLTELTNQLTEMSKQITSLNDKTVKNEESARKMQMEIPETADVLELIRQAKNLKEIAGTDFEYFATERDGGIIRCECCYERMREEPISMGKVGTKKFANQLSTGLKVLPDKIQNLLSGGNQQWYSLKSMLLDHAGCCTTRNGGMAHFESLRWKQRQRIIRNKHAEIVGNQLRAALLVVKTKAAAMHYENYIGTFYSCGADVGNIGHSRYQFIDMLKAFRCYALIKVKQMLTTPLKATGLPPHFATTSDKSTPGRMTNHAIMLLIVVNGERQAIPIDSPEVYKYDENLETLEGGTAKDLAIQVIESLKKTVKLEQENMCFLMSHQADGQYQASMFQSTLRQITAESEPRHSNTFFVVPWDTAHWLDLSMCKVRDECAHLSSFISRCNKFNLMFGRGKGFSEYQYTAKSKKLSANVPKIFAITRFFSSAFVQFDSIYRSYEALINAFENTRETSDDSEEMKYLIKGRDFCIDLCGIIDCLTPVMNMMTESQSLNQQIWSITEWWPLVRNTLSAMALNLQEQSVDISAAILDKSLFPKLAEHFIQLVKKDGNECSFKNVDLLEGWVVKNVSTITTGRKKTQRIDWTSRLPTECLIELSELCNTVKESIDARYNMCVSHAAHVLSYCINPNVILRSIEGKLPLDTLREDELQHVGEQQFLHFFEYICDLPQVKELSQRVPELKLCPSNSADVHMKYKKTIMKVLVDNLEDERGKWFVCDKDLPKTTCRYIKLLSNNELQKSYELQFDGGEYICKFNVKTMLSAFYLNEYIAEEFGQEVCICLDVAMAMGGTEAVVESYYSVMKSQEQAGGQTTENLTNRTHVDWCYPMPIKAGNAIKKVAELYLNGSKEFALNRHVLPVMVDERGKSHYSGKSKVLKRLTRKQESDKKYFVLDNP